LGSTLSEKAWARRFADRCACSGCAVSARPAAHACFPVCGRRGETRGMGDETAFVDLL